MWRDFFNQLHNFRTYLESKQQLPAIEKSPTFSFTLLFKAKYQLYFRFLFFCMNLEGDFNYLCAGA